MNLAPAIVLLALAVNAVMGAAAAPTEALEFFEKRVRPLFAEHCYECHSASAKKLKAGLRLDARASILRGGESGPAVMPGQPDDSLLLKAVRYHDKDLQMPPPQNGQARKLADAQIADLAEWVRLGAPMPEPLPGPNAAVPAQPHWAFLPPQNPPVPKVKNKAWAKTDLDRFVLTKLEAAKLRPAPLADRRTLLRRATFDLTGLPPTLSEVDAFLADKAPDAFARVVERLLASPRYGERWGRQWLDVARYADTKGYVYGREERFFVHAWTYRDWVVRAFNEDLPYDRFLLLQLAADQMVPEGSPDLAAMGFLTGGRRFIGVTRDIIDDRIDVVTRGTMGLTVACARCHDHKYDPIPTRDYYSLYGVFDSGEEKLISLGPKPEDKEFVQRATKLADTMKKRRTQAEARLRARVGDYLAAQLELQKYPEEGFDQILADGDLIPASVRRWRDFLHRTRDSFDPIFAPWHALAKLPIETFATKAEATLDDLRTRTSPPLNPLVARAFATPPKTMREVAERYGTLFADMEQQRKTPPLDPATERLARFLDDPRSPTSVPDTAIINNDTFFPTSACEELWKLQGEVDRWLIKASSPAPHALVLLDREPERNPRVFIRGNPARQGEEVPRQFPLIVAGAQRKPFQHGSGRLELAQAITSADNPLTARVMVNRIWQGHFGAGLVRTPSDFGLRAEPPSHPELLDWLAQRFIAEGWSVKRLHRLILLSAVYQQGGEASPRALETDPDNRLLSHFPRARLNFEQMRDAMLAVSGELDASLGGKASELFTAPHQRRTLYGLVDRRFLPGTFRIFDFANPDLSIAQRHATTVPQQSLFFLNHPFVAGRAKALAARADATASSAERVKRLYRDVYQRDPTTKETAQALRFVAAAEVEAAAPAAKPVATAWRYGWGEYDETAHRVKGFQDLPHFTGTAWQGAASLPGGESGWAQLTAEGGHPGNTRAYACIRRWVAPRDLNVNIAGTLQHEPAEGDGVRAFIVSSRHGELKSAVIRKAKADMTATHVAVRAGDTLDFIVDIGGTLSYDQFLWAPVITTEGEQWDARAEFNGPTSGLPLLAPWAQYAQVLLLANEFTFVD